MSSISSQQRYRKLHKKLGLCVDCARPAIPGLVKCMFCWSKDQRNNKIYYQANRERLLARMKKRSDRYKQENRCPRCGAPLMDSNGIVCINCSIQRQYANRGYIGGLLNEVNHKTTSVEP